MQLVNNSSNQNYNDFYQFIQAEKLQMQVVSQQILAGSRIQASQYGKVVFSQCNFYGCSFQDVTFDNCVFEDCTFNFSHFKNSRFINCNFSNCNWVASSSQQVVFQNCELELSLAAMLEGQGNQVLHLCPELSQTDIFECLIAAA